MPFSGLRFGAFSLHFRGIPVVKCGEQMGVRNYPAPSWDKVNPIFPAIANEQRPLPVPYMHTENEHLQQERFKGSCPNAEQRGCSLDFMTPPPSAARLSRKTLPSSYYIPGCLPSLSSVLQNIGTPREALFLPLLLVHLLVSASLLCLAPVTS